MAGESFLDNSYYWAHDESFSWWVNAQKIKKLLVYGFGLWFLGLKVSYNVCIIIMPPRGLHVWLIERINQSTVCTIV